MFTNSFEIKASEDEDRVVEFIASKFLMDRDREFLAIEGIDIKHYKSNPVVLWSHQSGNLPIGKAVKITKSGDELKIKVQFAPKETYEFADTIYRLVKGKYLNATSVGFIPDYDSITYDEKKGARTFNKSELLELSVVNVPSNPGALATGKSIQKAFEDKVISEDELKSFTEEKAFDNTAEMFEKLEKRIKDLEAKFEDNIDSYFDDLFKEFNSDSGAPSGGSDTNSKSLDDLVEDFLNEKQ